MARRASSEIYQVDLIAALFGGFMIAWLVSAEEVEFITASNSVVLVTIDLRVIGDVEEGGVSRKWWHGAVLDGAESEGCIPAEITELLDRRVANFIPCQYTQAATFSAESRDGARSFAVLMQKNGEDCAENAENVAPNNYSSFQRSLSVELDGTDGIEIIGFSTLRPSSISPGVSYYGRGAFFAPSFENCQYDSLNESIYAVGILSASDLPSSAGLNIRIVSTPSAYTVLNKSSTTAVGRLSIMTDVDLFDASGAFRRFGDSNVFESPRLSAAICFHDAEVASCMRGEGALAAGSTISLTRGPASW